jgi:MFS family permease
LIGGLVPLPFVFAFLMAAMLGAWSPIAMSMAQSLVPANDRSMAAAAWSMLAALIGGGLGPYLVGELSTQFNPRFGDEGIRYALAILAVFPLLAAALFAAIAKSIKRDMDLTRA